MSMEVRVKFSADLVIDGKDLAEIKEKWESMPLFSEEAMDYSAEFSEVLLVEEYPSYRDISEEWENAYTDGKVYDSRGVEIRVGDIVEMNGERYEIAEESSDSGIGSTGLPLLITSWVSGTTPCKVVGHKDDEDDDEDETPYDVNGVELCINDIVEWTDPETGKKTKYEVYEEPSEEMVRLWNKYGECEAFPCECRIIGHKGRKGSMTFEEYADYLYYLYRTNGDDKEYTGFYDIARGNTQMLKKEYRNALDESTIDDIVLTLLNRINGNC